MPTFDLTRQFPRILRAIHDQGWMGFTQFRIWRQVNEYLANNPEIFEYASAYWTISTNTLYDQALLSLSRLLDKHADAASAQYLLNLAERGADSLAHRGNKKQMILTQVLMDRNRLDRLRAKAKPIQAKRDRVLAHLDRGAAADLDELARMFPVDPVVVEQLFEELSEIVNTYSDFWDRSETVWDLIGGDDFAGLGRLLVLGKKTEEEELARGFRKARQK